MIITNMDIDLDIHREYFQKVSMLYHQLKNGVVENPPPFISTGFNFEYKTGIALKDNYFVRIEYPLIGSTQEMGDIKKYGRIIGLKSQDPSG